MESSTPVHPQRNDLRRRTLMRLVDTPMTTDTVNDESERSSRRSFIEMQKKMASPQQSPSMNDSVRFSGEQDIKEHLKTCTKLHAENKITTRIAWQLQIIDLLRVVAKKESSDTLQVASTSLDIGAKVYSLRVDDIHAEGLKLANSMARFAHNKPMQEGVEDNPEGGGEEGEGEEATAPKKRKKRKFHHTGGPKGTIAKDSNSLIAPLPKLESVFFSTRIDSDLSTVENLFTNRLPMDKSYYKFMVMSNEKAWPEGADEAVESLDKVSQFDEVLPTNGLICSAFQNFDLDEWDPEEEQKLHDDLSQRQNDDVVVYDEQGCPVAELDGSVCDGFDDDREFSVNDENEPEEDFVMRQMNQDAPHVVDLLASDNDLIRSEYSYNSVISIGNGKIIDQIWAGPSHWKLKFLRRNKSRFTGSVVDANARRTKKGKIIKKPQPIEDFKSDEVQDMLDNMKKIKNKKKINPANKVTLPLPDASCINLLNDIYELMVKPGTVPVTKKDTGAVNNYEICNNEEDNRDDNDDDFFDNMDNGMDNMDVDSDHMDEGEEIQQGQQRFMGDNLVDAPEYVPKTYIPYALQAKKMDMKKLKAFAWQLLTRDNILEEKVTVTTFSKLYADLPTVLPTAMKKELSCPLAFAALLHLCNEKTLRLKQHPEYRDFDIMSD